MAIAHVFETSRHILDENRIGARVDDGAAALGQNALLIVPNQLGKICRLGIIQLKTFGTQRFQLADLLVGPATLRPEQFHAMPVERSTFRDVLQRARAAA